MQSATRDFFSRSHDAVIRVYDEAGNVIETHEHAGEFKEWWKLPSGFGGFGGGTGPKETCSLAVF
jgi:hypothetical protein